MEPRMDVPMLQAARLVTRYCLPEGSGDLPYVTQQLDAYLDIFSSNWTIVKAYQRTRNLRCVQFVATRESAETLDLFFKRWLLNRTAESVASCKDLPTVRWLMEKYLPEVTVDNVAEIAGTLGYLEILQWLYDHQRDRVTFEGALCGALKNCHEHVVSWLREHVDIRVEIREDVLRSAVEAGNLDMIRWLCNTYGLSAADMLSDAINHCQTETVRWIIEKYDISNQTVGWYSLARDGKLSFLNCLVSRNIGMPGTALATFVIEKKLLPAAAGNGHLDVVK
ncbi:hypothetical protein P3T76_004310 [Phytophthora citrophthora]|uniref:Ankyrin repeat-containing domain n=1 Tax=Phytophthora citrophthora TaxID=4793 RepID=A0AAD9GUC1_9STRA|nr:hypothetical protein P3T76_004310 [Phytophthora citrophthora]